MGLSERSSRPGFFADHWQSQLAGAAIVSGPVLWEAARREGVSVATLIVFSLGGTFEPQIQECAKPGHRMKKKPSSLHRSWPMLGVLIIYGCAAGPELPLDDSGDAPLVVFADDADPALASLPSVENELLVQPFPGADAQALADLYADVGAAVVGILNEIDLTVLQVPPDELAQIANALADSELIEGVHRNYIYQTQQTANDPFFPFQRHLALIGVENAWDITVGAQEIVIGIVDTGIQPDHPDLAERIVDGWNFFEQTDDYADVAGHGTRVAGVVAAVSNNATGVAGVTWNCPILAIRVTNDLGGATSRDIAAGILWAVGHGARVINVSFAPLWSNSIVRAAARQAFHRGALVVISAGNGGGRTTSRGYREALFVGAVDELQDHATFSDRGPFVDVVAPGTSIRTTSLGSTYGRPSGTSFAAPIVAGVVALAWSANPDLRPTTIVDAVIDNAIDLGSALKDDLFGHGFVDAEAAVAAASRMSFVPDDTPPTVRIVRPGAGETLSGRSIVLVAATDDWGVADVVMSVDGVPFATDTRAPYRFVIAADSFTGGDHVLSLVATDLAGNASAPAIVTIDVALSPRGGSGSAADIVFKSPDAGSLVSGNVPITATVSSEAGLASVEWLIDGVQELVAPVSGRSAFVTFMWRSEGVARGSHAVTLVVTDASGLQTSGRLELTKQ